MSFLNYIIQIFKSENSDKDKLGGNDVGAIRMIHDPTSFSERLFAVLRGGSFVCLPALNFFNLVF